jgi:hypothetical protein
MKWKDATSYSRDDKEKVPNAFQLENVSFRLSVHRMHRLQGWFLTCYDVGRLFEGRQLVAEDLEEAKKEAVDLVYEKLKGMLEQLDVAMATKPPKKKKR